MTGTRTGLSAMVEGTDAPLGVESVPLTGVRIDVQARGTASAVTVAQRYVNREKVPVEADYSFPLEEGAAVCGFEAVIGEKLVVGRVEEKEKAFEEYDHAMAEGHGAYLLDQDRASLFTASIGNLLPGQQAVITVRYVAPLERHGDQIRLKVPTTVAPRYIPESQLRGMDPAEFDHLNPPTVPGDVPYGLALRVEFDGTSEVLGVECPSHPVRVGMAGTKATVELSGPEVQLDRDVVVSFTLADAGPTTARVARDDQGDYIVALDVVPPATEAREPVEAVFLIDRSGSMSGSSIAQARNALLLALGSLRRGDSFNVYGFGSSFESLFRGPVAYDDGTLDAARDAVRRWDADLGGTEIMAPLQEVLGQPAGELPRRVLLLTDGEVGNEQAVVELVGSHAASSTVFTIGVGYGASDVLVAGVARAGGGRAEHVHPNERIEPAVMRQMSRLTTSGLREVKVDWAGLPVDLVAPAVLPPLYPGSPLTVYGRVPADAVAGLDGGPVDVALLATGPDGDARFAAAVDVAAAEPDVAVPRLMAREAIRDLEEGRFAAVRRGSRQRARHERHDDQAVAVLAMRYTLMSSQTSFVAVEVREGAEIDDRGAELRRIPVALLEDWHGARGGIVQALSLQAFDGMRACSRRAVPRSSRLMGYQEPWSDASPIQCAAMADDFLDSEYEHGDIEASCVEPDLGALYVLAGSQRADGSWAWDAGVLASAGVERSDCAHLFGALGLGADVLDRVAPTLLAIGVFVRDFGDNEPEWRALVDKALAWLSAEGVAAPAGTVSLEGWLMDAMA